MARLRYNGLTATLGAALAAGDTTITFTAALTHSGGTAVPTITGTDYIPLSILDSAGSVAEIVNLTAYTTGATTGTIARAQESTTAKGHTSGTGVVHGLSVADLTTLPVVACRVKRVASYSFTNNAVTAIPWDGEWYDTHGFHDNATNNTRLTIPASAGAGLYSMRGVWVPDTAIAAGARVLCRIKVNGVEVGGTEIEGGGVFASPAFALDHDLLVADYVEFCSFVAGSGSTPLNLANTTFSIRKVGTI